MFKAAQIKTFGIASLFLASAFAAAVQAAPAAMSRDTGVGLLIAAQGNQALEQIRAETRRAVRRWRLSLPEAQIVPASLPAPAPGGAVTMAPAQRCAE